MPFDPNAAAAPDAGIFGLPFSRAESRVVVVPVPFEATVSYGGGTANGPDAVRRASAQVDLDDRRFGDAWRAGIFAEDEDPRFRAWGEEARALASPIVERGGAGADDAGTVRRVNELSERMNALVREKVAAILDEGRIPCLLGGEHSVSFGAVQACAERGELGVLQVDAHMDLRDAFEGFTWSHASVMHNVVRRLPGVARLVQVGIRDFGPSERALADSSIANTGRRVVAHYDDDLFDARDAGEAWSQRCTRVIADLPRRVYVSFDIDGLDPALCPHTGTPVPGGLSFREASALLQCLARSGREIAGFDLVEVAPGPEGDEWDANVGARVLFRLCLAAMIAGKA